jgi:exosome complex RNA-binding protein Rrp42 (RNase PH superfamily)
VLCKRTSKNRLTIPKTIAAKFPGVVYFDASIEGDAIMLRPVTITAREGPDLEAIRDKMERLGVTVQDLEKAIRTARRRSRT